MLSINSSRSSNGCCCACCGGSYSCSSIDFIKGNPSEAPHYDFPAHHVLEDPAAWEELAGVEY